MAALGALRRSGRHGECRGAAMKSQCMFYTTMAGALCPLCRKEVTAGVTHFCGSDDKPKTKPSRKRLKKENTKA